MGRTLRAIAIAVGILAVHVARGEAQVIQGRVFMPDSVTPAGGILVTATAGKTTARALSAASGRYVLRLGAPGHFEVRALRVGYRPAVVIVAVAPSETVTRDIVLSSLPVQLAGVDIKAGGDCALKGKDGQTFLTLWEQARGALAATQLWEQGGALDVRMVRVDGHTDNVVPYTDSLFAEVDTLTARELIVHRVLAATSPDSLFTYGFVRETADGRSVFDIPNAETILADRFVDAHCFTVEKSSEHKDWIGLGFKPRRRGSVVDISGVLWVERVTAELRRLDFLYTNLPEGEFRICDDAPWVLMTPERVKEQPPFEQPRPRCETRANGRSNLLGLGGSADFARLRGGEWLIANVTLRTPPDKGRIRPMPWRAKIVDRKPVRCYFGPDCHTLLTMRPRLVTSMSTVTEVLRDGVRLFQNDSAAPLILAMSTKRAGRTPAGMKGLVQDEAGQPLANAIVQTESPWRATFTDRAGAFEILSLPAGGITVSVRCRGFRTRRVSVPLLADSVRALAVPMTRDTTVPGGPNCAALPQ